MSGTALDDVKNRKSHRVEISTSKLEGRLVLSCSCSVPVTNDSGLSSKAKSSEAFDF